MEVLAGRESEGFAHGAGSDAAMDGDVNVENLAALNVEASQQLLELPPSASLESKRHRESKLRKGSPPLICKLCKIVFHNAQALGGHRSNSAEHVERLKKLSPKEKIDYLDEGITLQSSYNLISNIRVILQAFLIRPLALSDVLARWCTHSLRYTQGTLCTTLLSLA
jgi:hypothetical protein